MIPWYWTFFIAVISAGLGFMCAAVLASNRISDLEGQYRRILVRLHDLTVGGGKP